MKNTKVWVFCLRKALARSTGRISSMEAPVVPITLAITVPKASSAVLVAGVPISAPFNSTPPPVTYSASSRAMKGMYSCKTICQTSATATMGP